ncbi:hypothetical protein [Streptomyces pseudogriseolus]|uniref:hypothetical protein n=1 Tax=Streptomyces pseudogriseolus TaxID=36817 RepID=UPI003FA33D06
MRHLECRRTRWSSTAEIRLRYATVDFAHAVFEHPLTIAAEPDPFVLTNGRPLAEDLFPSVPHDFPPYKTVYDYYAKWEADGTTRQVHDLLRDKTRRAHGRSA